MIVVIVLFGMIFLYIFYYYRVAQSKRQQAKQLETTGPDGAQIVKSERIEEIYFLAGTPIILIAALGTATALLLLTDIPTILIVLIAIAIMIAIHVVLRRMVLNRVQPPFTYKPSTISFFSISNLQVLLAIGVLLFSAYILSLQSEKVREDQDDKPWKSITGVIDSRNGGQVYTYQLDGRTYIGSNFPEDDYTSDKTTYTDGESVTVFYDPDNHLRSALKKPLPSDALPILWVMGAFIVIGTGWIVRQILQNFIALPSQMNVSGE